MDDFFFTASKVPGVLLRTEAWGMIALGVTVLAIRLDRRRLALGASTATLLGFLLLSTLPLGDLLLAPLERSYPANPSLRHVDGIVVLGGAEDTDATSHWGQAQLNGAAERLTAALALARRFPEARVVFAGGGALGKVTDNPASEAATAAAFFLEQGLDAGRLILEGASRNTTENARLSLDLAKPGQHEIFVLVTSAWHMPRAVRSFTAAGWPAITPYPVDFRTSAFLSGVGWNLARNSDVLNIGIKEYAGSLAYELTGR